MLRPPTHQTVIIFDWDDTLLCGRFPRSRAAVDNLSPETAHLLGSIEVAARELLELALCLGHTFIITNAETGWVEDSATVWLPGLLPVLRRIRVISARSQYEARFPGAPKEVAQWKRHTFREVAQEFDSHMVTNLVAVGDADFEMDAALAMSKEFSQSVVKTVKLRENPSPLELLKQLELVSKRFVKIVESGRNLKITLTRKQPVCCDQ